MKRRWGAAALAVCVMIGISVGTAYGAEVLVGVDNSGDTVENFQENSSGSNRKWKRIHGRDRSGTSGFLGRYELAGAGRSGILHI